LRVIKKKKKLRGRNLVGEHATDVLGVPLPRGSRLSVKRNVKRFRGGRVFEAHRLLYHSTLGLRVIKKMKV